jgi:hypothetical protein
MLDPEKEQRYGWLRKLAQELRVPVPEAFLILEVCDKEGRLIQKHQQRSHSWVRNAYSVLFTEMAAVAGYSGHNLQVKDTDGTIRSIAPDDIWASAHAVGYVGMSPGKGPLVKEGYGYRSNDDTFGILVGSGVAAESFEDYALQAKIANGIGAGQLSYVDTAIYTVSDDGLTKICRWVRYFNNNSGGGIDVNEVGLVTYGKVSSGTSVKFMMSRDKLASTVTVPDTGQLKVTHTIQLTYPA